MINLEVRLCFNNHRYMGHPKNALSLINFLTTCDTVSSQTQEVRIFYILCNIYKILLYM